MMLVRLSNDKMVVTAVPICIGSSVTWPGGEASKGEEGFVDGCIEAVRKQDQAL